MINPAFFLKELQTIGITCFFGVPDSTLKHFCSFISSKLPKEQHTICVNEGVAISSAIGYHLATRKIPVVYMQNSGLGNSINPLTSLVAKEIYSIPLLLLIGWRGEPDVKDEPQHIFQGRITKSMLDTLEIPYDILDSESDMAKECTRIQQFFLKNQSPYALLVRKGTFSSSLADSNTTQENKYTITREEAIQAIVDSGGSNSIIVSTTGMTSRELFEAREGKNQNHDTDFLTVGGMGCASSIALGIARYCLDKQVICIDGDGAALMHMGAMGTIGALAPENLLHIVINNGEHGSTGGQPTISREIDLCNIAQSCGYEKVSRITAWVDLHDCIQNSVGKLSFIEIMTNNIYRKNLGRPTISPIENKSAFMKNFD